MPQCLPASPLHVVPMFCRESTLIITPAVESWGQGEWPTMMSLPIPSWKWVCSGAGTRGWRAPGGLFSGEMETQECAQDYTRLANKMAEPQSAVFLLYLPMHTHCPEKGNGTGLCLPAHSPGWTLAAPLTFPLSLGGFGETSPWHSLPGIHGVFAFPHRLFLPV